MRRGEIWTVAGGGDYTGKPRPAVVIQHDRFGGLGSVTICGFTSDLAEEYLYFRPVVQPSESNGLTELSAITVDKISTVKASRLGRLVGRLDEEDIAELNDALLLFLGFAG